LLHLAASLPARSAESWGMSTVRLIKHEAIPAAALSRSASTTAGFYFEDLPGRRRRPAVADGETTLGQAEAFARLELARRQRPKLDRTARRTWRGVG
jgi:hypothetical protein